MWLSLILSCWGAINALKPQPTKNKVGSVSWLLPRPSRFGAVSLGLCWPYCNCSSSVLGRPPLGGQTKKGRQLLACRWGPACLRGWAGAWVPCWSSQPYSGRKDKGGRGPAASPVLLGFSERRTQLFLLQQSRVQVGAWEFQRCSITAVDGVVLPHLALAGPMWIGPHSSPPPPLCCSCPLSLGTLHVQLGGRSFSSCGATKADF